MICPFDLISSARAPASHAERVFLSFEGGVGETFLSCSVRQVSAKCPLFPRFSAEIPVSCPPSVRQVSATPTNCPPFPCFSAGIAVFCPRCPPSVRAFGVFGEESPFFVRQVSAMWAAARVFPHPQRRAASRADSGSPRCRWYSTSAVATLSWTGPSVPPVNRSSISRTTANGNDIGSP